MFYRVYSFALAASTTGLVLVTSITAWAQILPDQTLGSESSVIQSVDTNNSRIVGGAQRNRNLFHSFNEFNVGEGHIVNFASPVGVENILSRVTGNNKSNILGALGVLGSANLFLLNPNGIIFGENSRLDIQGSFHATTAPDISLGNQGIFSAIDPASNQLLSVSPDTSFFSQVSSQSGSIVNQGKLRVGENQSLELNGSHVQHTGSLIAPAGTVSLFGNLVSLEGQAQIDVSASTGGGLVQVGLINQNTDLATGTVRAFIGPETTINANALVDGDAGQVVVEASEIAGFYGHINARGGAISGKGGLIQLSSHEHLLFRGQVDASAENGDFGKLILNSLNITIADEEQSELPIQSTLPLNKSNSLSDQILFSPITTFDSTPLTTIFEGDLEALNGDTDVSLQAINDIHLEDLIDDELKFTSGAGDIQLFADIGKMQMGSVILEDSTFDTIVTNGRNLEISGADVILGNVNTSDSTMGSQKSGDIKLIATQGSIRAGALNSSNTQNNGGNIRLHANGDININQINSSVIDSFDGMAEKSTHTSFSIHSTEILAENLIVSNQHANVSPEESTSGAIPKTSFKDLNSEIRIKSENDGKFLGLSPSKSKNGISHEPKEFIDSSDINSVGSHANAGDITVSSNGDVNIYQINSSTESDDGIAGNGGNILFSNISGNIDVGNINSASYGDSEAGNGGHIIFSGITGRVDVGNLDSSSYAFYDATGNGGSIFFSDIKGGVEINRSLNSSSFLGGGAQDEGVAGNGGTISFSDITGDVRIGYVFNDDETERLSLSSFSRSDTDISGDGGSIHFSNIQGNVSIKGDLNSYSLSMYERSGNGGAISFRDVSGSVDISGTLNSSSFIDGTNSSDSSGDGGAIIFSEISGDISINEGLYSFSRSINSVGNGGSIFISSDMGDIYIGNDIASFSLSENQVSGNAGDVTIQSNESISGEYTRILSFSATLGGEAQNEYSGILQAGGSVDLDANNISKFDIFTFSSNGQSGSVTIENFDDNLKLNNVNLVSSAQVVVPDPFDPDAVDTLTIEGDDFGPSGDVLIISSGNLTLNSIVLESSSNGSNVAGDFLLRSSGDISLLDSRINSNANDEGDAGSIEIFAPGSIMFAGANISAVAQGSGDAGSITVADFNSQSRSIRLDNSEITTEIQSTATFDSSQEILPSNINLNAQSLSLNNGSLISASTASGLDAGVVSVTSAQTLVAGGSRIETQTSSEGDAGNILISSNTLEVLEGSAIAASTSANGQGGNIIINASDTLLIGGSGEISVSTTASGNAGNIEINSQTLNLDDGIEIAARSDLISENTESNDQILNLSEDVDLSPITPSDDELGDAGNITINVMRAFEANNSEISTEADASSGGDISIDADSIRLTNTNIETDVSSGEEAGGDILLQADSSILAFGDTNILASSTEGSGGNITFDTPIFLGEGFSFTSEPVNDDDGVLVTIDATGEISTGVISTPDVSFIEEGLIELPQDPVDSSTLISNSCIVRTNTQQGNFIVTGSGGIANRPGDPIIGRFPTGTVQTIPQSSQATSIETQPNRPWKLGDPIVEPQGIYRLPQGRLVMSRSCS